MAESEAVRSKRLPRAVVALGFVSLFMDVSSEMIHAALPLFLTLGLGASALAVGLIEGIAEATASITKVFAGVASDWLGRRKPFALLGYGLAALSKPLFPLATSAPMVLLARFADRIGKGIRGAPRDALVADLTPEVQRGAAYGLRQALDTVGAMLGPALALLLLALTADDYRFVFWVAVAPAFFAVALLAWGVREPERPQGAVHERPQGAVHERPQGAVQSRSPIRRAQLSRLSRRYWGVVAFGAVLTLARFSEAFLVLRAADVGLAATYAPLAMVVMNAGFAATAYPLGRLSDRGRRPVAILGVACLLLADGVLVFAAGPALALMGALLWGVHMGATQGLLSAVVADTAPADLRGTAFGLFNLVVGATQLAASLLAGALWSAVGPEATFAAGAVFSTMALVGLLGVRRRRA